MSIAYNPKIVTDGIQLYLDAANNKSYSGSGNIWYNIVGDQNAEIFNSVAYDSSDKSFDFDGTDDYMQTTLLVDSSGTQPYTLCAWLYKKNNANDWSNEYRGRIFASGAFGGSFGLIRNTNAASNTSFAMWIRGQTSGSGSANGNVVRGKWNYIVGTWNGTNTLQCYVNGNLKNENSSVSISGGLDNSVFSIGGDGAFSGSSGSYFKEKIACVSVYKRVLSASEINQNFNALRSRFGL